MNIGIILARKNSQRLKNKNLLKIGKLSLIERAITSALNSKQFKDIVVSTDDKRILKLKKKYKNVLFEKRPKNLSGPKVRVIQVVLDILTKNKNKYSNVALLLPTCPFRKTQDIINSFKIFKRNKLNTISVTDYEFPPEFSIIKKGNIFKPEKSSPLLKNKTRSQDFKKKLRPNGAIYIGKIQKILILKNFYDKRINIYKMPRERSIDIDTNLDFIIAKALYAKNQKK